jgi:aldehyde:ferredoxin oxidoreductase
MRAYMISPEILGGPKKADPLTFSGKAGLVQDLQDEIAAFDSLALCRFASFAAGREEFADLLSNATGVRYSAGDFMKCGERIWNLERMFNIRAGFSRKDDTLPDRFFKSDGINRKEFEKSLDEYYRLRGWDEKGVPTEEKLSELDM